MSVINESRAGDALYCVDGFVTSPHGQPFSWDTCRRFKRGHKVRYVGWYQDKNVPDNPICWMVVFEAADGKQYAATQTSFVTKESWLGLREHFTKALRSAKGKNSKLSLSLTGTDKRTYAKKKA